MLQASFEFLCEIVKERIRSHCPAKADDVHLCSTAAWLLHAQDATPDGGISRGYRAAPWPYSNRNGWYPSYPETTGYIIPTMFILASVLSESDYRERAFRMADWECDIQFPSGAVMGSVVTAPPTPAVFNTGQVIFGWLAAYRESGESKYLQAGSRAGKYLLAVQEVDGSWQKGNSQYALTRATTYNTRVAWALIELAMVSKRSDFKEAGIRNIEFALTRQKENGWFSDNCLNDPVRPLLHTIIYATRGILEAGILLQKSRYISAAMRTLDALRKCQRADGGLPGRLASDWSAQAHWDCLTGVAQAAVAWLRAYSLTGNSVYFEAARGAIDFVKRTQNLEHSNPGIRGGVKGSYPFYGRYGQFEMLNWAAKFFCDALLMISDPHLSKNGIKG